MTDEQKPVKENWYVATHRMAFDFLRDVIDEFTDIIKEILMPRTFFALMFYVVFCYLTLKQQPVPDTLQSIVNMLMGYWFGSRVGDKATNGNGKDKEIP